jgi:hypothetical protein
MRLNFSDLTFISPFFEATNRKRKKLFTKSHLSIKWWVNGEYAFTSNNEGMREMLTFFCAELKHNHVA